MSKLYSLLSTLSSGGAVALLALAMFSAPSNLYAVDPGGGPDNCYSTDGVPVPCVTPSCSTCSNGCTGINVPNCGTAYCNALAGCNCSCKGPNQARPVDGEACACY